MYTVIITTGITLTATRRKTAQYAQALLLIDRAYTVSTLAEVAECRKAIAPFLEVYSGYTEIGLDLRIADGYLSDIEWEHSADRQRLKEWLNNPANWDSEGYSDIYKEVYGRRP